MDEVILAVNEAKYCASEQTLFMKEIADVFGYLGQSDTVDAVFAAVVHKVW